MFYQIRQNRAPHPAAVGSALEFLARNGYQLKTTSYELYQFTIEVASEDVKADRKEILMQIKQWIEARLMPMK